VDGREPVSQLPGQAVGYLGRLIDGIFDVRPQVGAVGVQRDDAEASPAHRSELQAAVGQRCD
jgi:hypothetical protein